MIDTHAFAEWIVAKAAKQGAFTSEENLRVAREAAEVALGRDGDEVHVTCVLAGSSGTVAIDERMTRMAIEVLFPKVAIAHPVPLFDPKPERPPKIETPREPVDYEAIERERREVIRTRRVLYAVIALAVLVIAALVSVITFANRDEHDSHGKRETHHH
jgi:hypothetical protein